MDEVLARAMTRKAERIVWLALAKVLVPRQ
jgi:hypothetical protein